MSSFCDFREQQEEKKAFLFFCFFFVVVVAILPACFSFLTHQAYLVFSDVLKEY